MPYTKSAAKPPKAVYHKSGTKDYTKSGMKYKRGSMGTKYKSHNPY